MRAACGLRTQAATDRLAKASTLQQELSGKVTNLAEQLAAAELELQDVNGKVAEADKEIAAVREMAVGGPLQARCAGRQWR